MWEPTHALRAVEDHREAGPSAAYEELLAECPVTKVQVRGSREGYWGVFSYAEVDRAARDTKTLSNVTIPPDGPRLLPLQSDPPEHATYRRRLNRFFSDEAMSKLEQRVRPLAVEMVDAMVAAAHADFAAEMAYPYPTRVLCAFLGLPEEDWHFLHRWNRAMAEATNHGLADLDGPVPAEQGGELMPYLQQIVADRRAEPRDDLISVLLTGSDMSEPVSDMVVGQIVTTIMLAGHITTTAGLGNLVLRIAGDTALQSTLRARPDRVTDAVEESLRLDTPQQVMPRMCTVDTTLGGSQIRAGERVLLSFGSANVDPDRWTSPEQFDLDRSGRHLAFGRGVHQCVGAPMARMEMRLVAEELLARTASFAVSGPVVRQTWPLLAVDELPLAFEVARPRQ